MFKKIYYLYLIVKARIKNLFNDDKKDIQKDIYPLW